jgi:DNA (cytosine-5)-methyltransferase 1
MAVYYNENDKFAAAWLKELIADGLIAKGEVDDRSICDVQKEDVIGYTQCHFFAGIGGWSYALRLAGWPDDREVWTGSCPCQPFSTAGKQEGTADNRHLWPTFFTLIAQCRPSTIFGEQVASKLGREWLATVRAEMETLGYAVGAADIGAASVGAPHIRQRLWWVADAKNERRDGRSTQTTRERQKGQRERLDVWGAFGRHGKDSGMADADSLRQQEAAPSGSGRHTDSGDQIERFADANRRRREQRDEIVGPISKSDAHGVVDGGLGNADNTRPQGLRRESHRFNDTAGREVAERRAWTTGTFIPCADGKARLVEPGIFPLAHGFPNRVGILRGAGNAICPQVAAEFVKAFNDCRQ